MLLIRILLLLVALPAVSATAEGAIKLDNWTFNTVVERMNVLVKFDKPYVYGENEDHFKNLCKFAYKVSDFVTAEVPVQDYENKDNDDLRQHYGISVDDFPVYLLFKKTVSNPIKYDGFPNPAVKQPKNWDEEEDGVFQAPLLEERTAENIANWLQMHDVKYPSIGTIAEMDDLARQFMANDFSDDIKIKAAALKAGKFADDPKAPVYLRIMDKVKDKGKGYIEQEVDRIKKIMAGEISFTKQEQLSDKLRILKVFRIG